MSLAIDLEIGNVPLASPFLREWDSTARSRAFGRRMARPLD